ncbi:MAG: hypothetical protein C5B53_02135 [Candidatus Melainabacteria bacterium]|nr:MAG: hypothetical protein C5B53_02135 [Candidatus Melainabacteria bacterium]
MDYLFDGFAKERSKKTLQEQLPALIYNAAVNDVAPTLQDLFELRCNDTPVVRQEVSLVHSTTFQKNSA